MPPHITSIEEDPVWKQIDASAYLFLNRLFEPRDNSLTIVLEEAVANESKRRPTVVAGISLGESCPVEPTPDCSVFRLDWKTYSIVLRDDFAVETRVWPIGADSASVPVTCMRFRTEEPKAS